MIIQYENYDDDYNPQAISWVFNEKKVSIDFPFAISAVFAEPIEKIIIEVYQENELHFYNLDGELAFKTEIPVKTGYKFKGLNKNKKSKSGISLLFHPREQSDGNTWDDTEQYELKLNDNEDLLGEKLGIYR